jgi:hypothetical protein
VRFDIIIRYYSGIAFLLLPLLLLLLLHLFLFSPVDPCCADPCNLESQWNFANNEHNYAMLLQASFANVAPGFVPRFITDTGRNGVADMRQSCSDWCNIRGAGTMRRFC